MRVLWLTCTAAGASKVLNQRTHDRGWIASLGELIKADNSIQLAVAFFDNHRKDFKFEYEAITYYPMPDKLATRIGQLKSRSLGKHWDTNLQATIRVIEDFKPDIIHLFGTESGIGDIVGHTNVPVIIHLQGLINPYVDNWLPRGITLQAILFKSNMKELLMRRDLVSKYFIYKKIARREEHLLKRTKYFFGRTSWDKRVLRLFNPEAKYFHCEEVLRPVFYENAGKWQNNASNVLRLVSTINPETYKGLDIVLKTVEILKKQTALNFEWHIVGIQHDNRVVRIMEKNKKNRFKNFPVVFRGVKQASEVVSELLMSNIFIHPSHSDNSPNSVCEAMMLGMPVIASYVGGIPSLIQHGTDGLLYNSNDSYDLAGMILECSQNQEYLDELAKRAAKTARERHEPAGIITSIREIYKTVLADHH